jgi:Autophagy-related protein 101
MSIQFFEKVTRRASWWASKAAESEVCWEKWDINCEFLPLSRNDRGTSTLSQACLWRALSPFYPFVVYIAWLVLTPLVVDRSKARAVMEGQLTAALRKIVFLTQRTDHIPPITTNEANPFPYQVRTQTPGSSFYGRY